MNAAEAKPKWTHWTLLALCGAGLLTLGIFDIAFGAFPGSRYYAIDDVVVRLLGIGKVTSALGLALRRNWGFIGGISVLVLSAVESLLTPVDSAPLHPVTKLVLVLLFAVLPVVLLAWLRGVFLPYRLSR